MAVNKVTVNGRTILDLTNDTVKPYKLMEGATAHDAAGNKIVGTLKNETKPYLTFKSPYPFTLSCTTPGWDATMEISSDGAIWTVWDGSITSSGTDSKDNYECLYLRGIGNTTMYNVSGTTGLTFDGTSIRCIGNVETLLDYETVATGGHPVMVENCFRFFFRNCPIVTPPELLAVDLSERCYYGMFAGCTHLVEAPKLPAVTLAAGCYQTMFSSCTSLVTAPELPAVVLTDDCYRLMFAGCTSLVALPRLPAKNLPLGCYRNMLSNCTLLKLAAAKDDEYTVSYRIPFSGASGTVESNSLIGMFANTGGTFKGAPSINTTYYLSNTNTVV